MDEQVDIVNEQDEIVGTTSKRDAHEKGLLHRCVIAEVIDSHGNWILVKQAADRQEPGKYVSPMGGHVSKGESNDHALARELEEELGYKPHEYTSRFVGKCLYNTYVRNRQENHYFVVYEIRTDVMPRLGIEAASWKKFSPEELKKLLKTNPEQFGNVFFPILTNLYPHILPKD